MSETEKISSNECGMGKRKWEAEILSARLRLCGPGISLLGHSSFYQPAFGFPFYKLEKACSENLRGFSKVTKLEKEKSKNYGFREERTWTGS